MLAPLLAIITLFGQGATESSFVGHWEGTITYSRPNDTLVKEITIEDLVIDDQLVVSGTFGKPAAKSSETRIGNGKSKISPDGEFDRTLLWVGKNTALCNFSGTVELSKDGQTMTGKKFIVRDFGTINGSSDDEYCTAKLELHRKPIKGATAPFFFYRPNLKDRICSLLCADR